MTAKLEESTLVPDQSFAIPASAEALTRTAEALAANGITAEILDNVAAARARIAQLLPEGASVYTSASETLKGSGIEEDINTSGRYNAVKPRVWSLDRATQADEIRQIASIPDVVVGSVSAVTEEGSLFAVSASGSQMASYAGGAGRVILVVGAQKVVRDHNAALQRITSYAYPLEDVRCRQAYGVPSAINKILIVNREYMKGRTTVLLVREAIGY